MSNSVCNHTRDWQIGLPLHGRPILSITNMIAERIGLHSVLLLLLIAYTLTTRSWKIQIFKFVPMLWFTLYGLLTLNVCVYWNLPLVFEPQRCNKHLTNPVFPIRTVSYGPRNPSKKKLSPWLMERTSNSVTKR